MSKLNFKMVGTCAACGSKMELSGYRNAQDIEPLIVDKLRAEFRATRAARNMSLREVETETGISNAFLSQIETGKANDMTVGMYEKLRQWIRGKP